MPLGHSLRKVMYLNHLRTLRGALPEAQNTTDTSQDLRAALAGFTSNEVKVLEEFRTCVNDLRT